MDSQEREKERERGEERERENKTGKKREKERERVSTGVCSRLYALLSNSVYLDIPLSCPCSVDGAAAISTCMS